MLLLSFLQGHVVFPQMYSQALVTPASSGVQMEFLQLSFDMYTFPFTVKENILWIYQKVLKYFRHFY